MKLSSQEEYGLRCLLHLARTPPGRSMTIHEISQAEGLSVPNVAKLMRLLRLAGLVQSERGQSGGYLLAKPATGIMVEEVLAGLGGRFFSPEFCVRHAGRQDNCKHQVDCSLRVLWTRIQDVLSDVLGKTSLADLLCNEEQMTAMLDRRGSLLVSLNRNPPAGGAGAAAPPESTPPPPPR